MRRGSHLGRPSRPSPSLRRGVSGSPLTRGPVRLLGPCFKTGRAGAQLRSATRGATCHLTAPAAARPSTNAENSGRRGGMRGTGGAAPSRGGGGRGSKSLPRRPGRGCGRRYSFSKGAPREGPIRGATCAGAFARPEPPVPSAASGRSARATRRRRAGPVLSDPGGRRGTANRTLNLHGPVPRVLPVCFLAVSRPLELSLQSSFQLSLTVLVCYRSRASI